MAHSLQNSIPISSPFSMSEKQPRILSRERIVDLIADGKAIVIYKNSVLNLTSWLHKHPGGITAVYHMIGRDATDEMEAYHSLETMETFRKWKIGEIDHYWENLLPPIQGAVYYKGGMSSAPLALLEAKIDDTSSENSDVELLLSSASSAVSLNLENKGIGYPQGVVKPVVPQTASAVRKLDKDRVFPISRDQTIVDPKAILENYDNALTQRDLMELPELDYATQQGLRDKYHALHAELTAKGFYQCNYWAYVREIVKIGSLMLYLFSLLKLGWYFLSAVLMGLGWHQMTFIAHDAGHVSITHNYQLDNVFGILVANFCGGLSIGWWKRNHNVHHLVTNDPVHDPDIQHLPFFAVSVRLFQNVYSTYYGVTLPFDKVAEKMIPIQHYMYYPILCFGRFNLYVLSWMHLIRGQGPRQGKAAWFRYLELMGLGFFFYWFFYLVVGLSVEGNWNKFMYVMVSHITTMMVHVQITLLHFAMSTADLGMSESFPSRQIRTTMDVDCPEWFDFFHGGLQFQAIHHLFPRMPRHNFRKLQPYVIDFCKDVGLHYSIYGFGEGNEKVIGKLAEIGKQCSIMLEASKHAHEH